jgi:hypothetical protein
VGLKSTYQTQVYKSALLSPQRYEKVWPKWYVRHKFVRSQSDLYRQLFPKPSCQDTKNLGVLAFSGWELICYFPRFINPEELRHFSCNDSIRLEKKFCSFAWRLSANPLKYSFPHSRTVVDLALFTSVILFNGCCCTYIPIGTLKEGLFLQLEAAHETTDDHKRNRVTVGDIHKHPP